MSEYEPTIEEFKKQRAAMGKSMAHYMDSIMLEELNRTILKEGVVEKAAVDYLSKMIKASRFKGKVYIAGGYVRDELLGFDPKDIDLVVELPNGGIDFANWITKKTGTFKKGSNPVVFPKFGTAKFQLYGITHKGQDLSDIEIEVVMTRKEQYHDDKGRKPM